MKGVGVFQAIEEFAAFASTVRIENDGVDLANVGVNAVAEQEHLQQRNNQREEKRAEIPANVQCFLVKDGAESSKNITHVWPPSLGNPQDYCRWPGSCRSIPRKHLPGWGRAGEFRRRSHRFWRVARAVHRDRDGRRSGREWT